MRPIRCIGKTNGNDFSCEVIEILPSELDSPKNLVDRHSQFVTNTAAHELCIPIQLPLFFLQEAEFGWQL
jgi:hypothetical protein